MQFNVEGFLKEHTQTTFWPPKQLPRMLRRVVHCNIFTLRDFRPEMFWIWMSSSRHKKEMAWRLAVFLCCFISRYFFSRSELRVRQWLVVGRAMSEQSPTEWAIGWSQVRGQSSEFWISPDKLGRRKSRVAKQKHWWIQLSDWSTDYLIL